MTIAEGLRLGQQSNIANQRVGRSVNPMSAIPQLAASAANVRRNPNALRRTSPASIWENAAFLANQRKRLDMEQQKIDLLKEAQLNRQDEARYERERQGRLDLQGQGKAINDQYQGSMDAAQRRYAGDVGIIQSEEQAGQANRDRQQREDFGAAQRGLATKDPGPIMKYFNDYGSPDANVKDIVFDPEGGDEILVFPQGAKAGIHFKNAEEFYTKFMGVGSPAMQKSLKEREQIRKEKETEWKIGGGGKKLSDKDVADIRSKHGKWYNDKYRHPISGELDPNAPPEEESLKTWMTQKDTAGQPGPGTAEAPAASTSAKWSEKYQSWLVPVPGGGFKKVEGPKEYKPGTSPDEKGPKVRMAIPGGKEPVSKKQSRAAKSKQEPQDKGKAIPDKKKEKKQTGTVYYTDKKTGDKVKKTMYSDGTFNTVVTKKKKKKDKGKS